MLKIDTRNDAGTTIFELEGKLAGPWVGELFHCWRQAVVDKVAVRVVLKSVTFVDAEGRRLLADMHRDGAELAGEGCMTKAIIEAIKREGAPR